MAVLRPIVSTKVAFDATSDSLFTYIISGGNQIVKNRLVITNNSTSTVVYNNIETTYLTQQTLPANTLTNGGYYSYYFTVFDSLGNESSASNISNFYCYTTPIFEFNNITSGATISASSYTFSLLYNQAQSEKIQYALLNLIDSNGTTVQTSGNIYSDATPPFYITYKFENFLDKATYTVEAMLYTVEGTYAETSVDFSVNYYSSNMYTIVELENNCEEGYVEITNNMIIIDGTSYPSPPTYIDNEKVDLTSANSYVEWADGYEIDGDFTLSVKLDFDEIGRIITLYNANLDYNYNRIEMKLEQDYPYGEEVLRYVVALRVYNGSCCMYSIYSNYFDTLDNMFLWVRRINNIYDIKVEVLT